MIRKKMNKEKYLHRKPFMGEWLKDENGQFKGIEWKRDFYNKVVRLTEKISKGDEPNFHAIMETFVKIYPEVKRIANAVRVKDQLSKEHSQASEIKGAVDRATKIRLTIKGNRLTDIRMSFDRTSKAVPYSYIGIADYDLYMNENLKWMLGAKGAVIEFTPNESEWDAVKQFLKYTLQRDDILGKQNAKKRLYEVLKELYDVVHETGVNFSDTCDYIQDLCTIENLLEEELDIDRFRK